MSELLSEPSAPSERAGDVESAASLVALGMRPKLLPARDPVYAELVRRYGADDRFTDLVNRVAAGLGLVVLAVTKQSGAVTTRGIVTKALRFLAEQGFLVAISGDGVTYRSTPRYQVQVRELAAQRTFDELLELGALPVTGATGSLQTHHRDTLS